MNPCLRAPQSLADADAILTCLGGPDWRSLALTGLGVVFVFAVIFTVAYWLTFRAGR